MQYEPLYAVVRVDKRMSFILHHILHKRAITLGERIYVRDKTDARDSRLMRHEFAHVLQWRRYGLKFAIMYLWENWRQGYKRNIYEIAARRASNGVK